MRRALFALTLVLALLPTPAGAAFSTYHLDLARTGNDTGEPAARSIPADWTSPTLDGMLYGEPLVSGSTVIVATENDSVYGLSISTGAVLWQRSLGTPVPRAVLPCNNPDLDPVGITSTPVIDPATNILYVVALSWQSGMASTVAYHLFALDLNASGASLWQDTLDPANFDPFPQGQRGALALSQGRVYVPFGGRYGDCGTYTGVVMAAPASGAVASSNLLTFRLPSQDNGGGFWAPSGEAVDSNGNLFVTSGNTTNCAGCSYDFGDTVLKLTPGLALADYFAPSEWQQLNVQDTDLGSLAPTLLTPSLLFQAGKSGDGFLINTGRLGHIGGQLFRASACPGQTADAAFGGTAWAPPYLYVPCTGGLAALSVTTGASPSFSVVWQGPAVSNSGPPIVAGGLVWTIDPGGTLYGLNPATGAVQFSAAIPGAAQAGAAHFPTPAADGGRLLVPTGLTLTAFALLGFKPGSLTFGNQALNTSSPSQTATFTNTGPAAITIASIAATGDFAESNACPASLAVDASCTISVNFHPTAAGARSGTLTMTAGAPAGTQSVGLTGYSYPFTAMDTIDAYGGLHADGGSPAVTASAYWPGWPIARSAALMPGSSGSYTLDGYGGLHPFGGAPTVTGEAYWSGWDIARDVALLGTGGGYTLDGYGGLHEFGGAPKASQAGHYWSGWDIARRVVLLSDGTGGYVMDGYGGLHPFAIGLNSPPPAIANETYWPGWRIARDLVLTPGSTASAVSGYTLDGYGGLHPFSAGPAGATPQGGPYWSGWDIARSVVLSPGSTAQSPQGWVMDGYGGIHSFGGAPQLAGNPYWPGWDVALRLVSQ